MSMALWEREPRRSGTTKPSHSKETPGEEHEVAARRETVGYPRALTHRPPRFRCVLTQQHTFSLWPRATQSPLLEWMSVHSDGCFGSVIGLCVLSAAHPSPSSSFVKRSRQVFVLVVFHLWWVALKEAQSPKCSGSS